jgi:hypothetical protein
VKPVAQITACPEAKFSIGAGEAGWAGWGVDLSNTRFQSGKAAGLDRDKVARLKLKWAFGFEGQPTVMARPVVAGGRLFFGGADGTVYSLDARTGCQYAPLMVRTAISLEGDGTGPLRAVFRRHQGERLCAGRTDGRAALADAGRYAPGGAHYRCADAGGRQAVCAGVLGGGSAGAEPEVLLLYVSRQRGRAGHNDGHADLEKLHYPRSAQGDSGQLDRRAVDGTCRSGGMVRAHDRPEAESDLCRHGKQLQRSGRQAHRRHHRVRYGDGQHALVAADDAGRRLELLLHQSEQSELSGEPVRGRRY